MCYKYNVLTMLPLCGKKKRRIKLMSDAKEGGGERESTRSRTRADSAARRGEKIPPTDFIIIRADGSAECKWPMQSIRETTLTLW